MKGMRIFYNPYEKQFNFQYASDGENFNNIANQATLAKYTNRGIALLNCLPEIFDEISKEYAHDSDGIKVEFCGTSSDYVNFCNTLISYTKKLSKNDLKYEKLHYELISSTEALKKIESAYERIKNEFPAEGSAATEKTREIASLIKKYNDATKSELNLVIVGTYSSGKSTFINALIGEELLPQGEDPVTAQIFKISSASRYSIRFSVVRDAEDADLPETIEMRWDDGSFQFHQDKLCEEASTLLQELKECAEERSGENPIVQMNAVIGFFNDLKTNGISCSIAPLLQITLPFRIGDVTNDELSINIFDTPGSNATTAPSHLETLKEALGQQTNALPILVIERSAMASRGNDTLKKLLKDYATNMDLANMLVVITHGDQISLSDLKAGFKEEALNEWSFKKILFLSSIVALGIKKDGNLLVDAYKEKYSKNKDSFCKGNDFYRSLYQYAILPDENEKAVLEQIAATAKKPLYHDCGIFSVEYEIKIYAEKFLWYLKARQRRTYLLDALQKAKCQLEDMKAKEAESKKEHEESKTRKKGELNKKLNKFTIKDEEYRSILDEMKEKFDSQDTTFLNGLQSETKHKWDQIPFSLFRDFGDEGIKNQEKVDVHMVAHCNRYVQKTFPDRINFLEKRNQDLTKKAWERLSEIIQADPELSDETKENFWNQMDYEIPKFKTSNSPKFDHENAFGNFLCFHWIDPERYSKKLKVSFNAFHTDECVITPYTNFREQFNHWVKLTKENFNNKLETVSLILREYDEPIRRMADEIEQMSERIENLSSVEQELIDLLNFPKEVLK
ncbi:dynamin family protein [Pelosinus sp. sgz500959]|uniref:dynamin family protein n=1 Tax=Pelosinus sp. sgz500959 TaxID=3242472 RepID=UPI00366EBA70